MNKLLFGTAIAALALASPAQARLQISISANGASFSCFDGQGSCDLSGGANNLLLIDQSVGGAFVQIALGTSTFGNPNLLTLSSSNITNTSGAPISIVLTASDTSFVSPIKSVSESSSLTFNQAVGSPASFERFFADAANGQGAPGTPGTLLFTATGTPLTNPDSFEGTNTSIFAANAPFSMSEQAVLNLASGGSITGFSQDMQSAAGVVPEPSTWAMFGIGFGVMALMGLKRSHKSRLASI